MSAEQSMIDNLHKNTGKTLDEWIAIVKKENFNKHGEILKFLKTEHGFTHGFANLVAHKAKGSDAGSVSNTDDLITAQYAGKDTLRPIYDALIQTIQTFGDDVEFAPKKAYVSVRRKKQFAMLTPATKTRFEIGINLKGLPGEGRLEEITKANAMCSHVVKVTAIAELGDDITGWLKKAYEDAG